MNEPSLSEQAAVPAQAATEAQDTYTKETHYSGGDALLAAEVEVSERRSSDAIVEEPIATNFAQQSDTDEPTDAKNFTTTGDYPVDQKHLEQDYSSLPIGNEPDTTD